MGDFSPCISCFHYSGVCTCHDSAVLRNGPQSCSANRSADRRLPILAVDAFTICGLHSRHECSVLHNTVIVCPTFCWAISTMFNSPSHETPRLVVARLPTTANILCKK